MNAEAAGWILDEVARSGDEHLDPEYAEGYDRKSGTDTADDLALLRELGLDARSTLVDLGAGTGTFAVAAAPYCGRVVAVDVSAAMLGVSRTKVERLALGNVELVRAGFLTYEHRGDPAEFVYSRNALHHLPDLWKALALERVARILRPGGVLRLHDLVLSCDPAEVPDVIEARLASAAERPKDGWTRSELEAHFREEHSTFSWLLEPMLERAGFEIREATFRDSQVYAAYTCTRRL